MIKIYIASAYTLGDVAVNVRLQIDTADALMNLGLLPFAPLMSHFHHLIHPKTYEEWMRWDFGWLACCDYVLRLDGESKGADMEVTMARELNIPVFYSFQELLKEKDNLRKRI